MHKINSGISRIFVKMLKLVCALAIGEAPIDPNHAVKYLNNASFS